MGKKFRQFMGEIEGKILAGDSLSLQEALALNGKISLNDLPALFEISDRIREKSFSRRIKLCAITNAKSGYCSEDCIFCAQSLHHQAQVNSYPLLSAKQLIEKATQAEAMGVHCFSMVTSGHKIENPKEIECIIEAIQKINELFPSLSCSASLGTISFNTLIDLKHAGLQRYHHNLETSESFFPKVCTTHSFKQRRKTVEAAKAAGLQICSGGIFGLGETFQQRLELAFTLKELEVDSIPINFLHPVKGTRCEERGLIAALEALKTIAFFRLILPETNMYVCGGRQITLRSLQSWIFLAGANGMMVGNYLTTKGSPWSEDQTMIRDLGFIPSSKSS